MARPETGTMKFEGDWRGVFIRGDDAYAYAAHLDALISKSDDVISNAVLLGLKNLLLSADERTEAPSVQKMRQFDACHT